MTAILLILAAALFLAFGAICINARRDFLEEGKADAYLRAARYAANIAFALALVFAFAGGRASAATVDYHTAPAENLEHVDIETLATARETVDIAAYVLSDWAIMDALRDAARRGVAVRLILDGSQFTPKNQGDRILALAREPNVDLRIRPSDRADIMHFKAYCIDGKRLRTGSANFSASGLKRQDNDLLLTDDARAIATFGKTFEVIWDRSKGAPE